MCLQHYNALSNILFFQLVNNTSSTSLQTVYHPLLLLLKLVFTKKKKIQKEKNYKIWQKKNANYKFQINAPNKFLLIEAAKWPKLYYWSFASGAKIFQVKYCLFHKETFVLQNTFHLSCRKTQYYSSKTFS